MLRSWLPWQLDLFSSQTKTFVFEITGRIQAWKQADSCSEDLPLHGRTQESRRVGSFCFQADQNVLGRSPSFSRGYGGMLPQENFGKMEPNTAILCILAVKQSDCSMVRSQKVHRNYKNKISFG